MSESLYPRHASPGAIVSDGAPLTERDRREAIDHVLSIRANAKRLQASYEIANILSAVGRLEQLIKSWKVAA